jgi:2-oxoglutarate ferredoxin oxidoreductase subunit beta
MTEATLPKLTKKDFESNQEVRWCPGCGDYSILAQMQKTLPELGIPREKIVFISGIGCSSRFPYYMETYGMHSIHGRAPTFATGLKLANPELSVWVITGDGDGLSIGGNHLLHILRRNMDVNIVLFNNQIYGLTKGQYSPTSRLGHKTKSSPMGTIDQPLNPLSVALAAEATFVARSIDVETKHLSEVLLRAAQHRGTSFVEVFQNCNIFNDGVWRHLTDPEQKKQNLLRLEHGKPLVFGPDNSKGIRLNGLTPEVVELGNGVTEADLLVHDESRPDASAAYLLTRMTYPAYPVPIGVFRCLETRTYEDALTGQLNQALQERGVGDLDKLFRSADLWTVSEGNGKT